MMTLRAVGLTVVLGCSWRRSITWSIVSTVINNSLTQASTRSLGGVVQPHFRQHINHLSKAFKWNRLIPWSVLVGPSLPVSNCGYPYLLFAIVQIDEWVFFLKSLTLLACSAHFPSSSLPSAWRLPAAFYLILEQTLACHWRGPSSPIIVTFYRIGWCWWVSFFSTVSYTFGVLNSLALISRCSKQIPH